jgi:glyoxylase-like metal-dependent hydrolase (beta-lactamase superfamily II)/rhodanese-related sulfurtransferase
MIVRRYYLKCLSHASYLVGDEASREAAIIDPQRDLDRYLEDIAREGWRLKYVIETHAHADFVSGHWDLAARTGAEVVFGAAARATLPHRKVRDGETLALGKDVTLAILETPGHTPDSICVLARDRTRPGDAGDLFTGDTLFVGSVGRPDLLGDRVPGTELAAALYDSLERKLLSLPDATRVYPAHGAGSACGRGIGSAEHSTIGEEKATNPLLRLKDRKEFIGEVLRDLPHAPAYFPEDARLNLEGMPPLEEELTRLRPLNADRVAEAQAKGAVILDVRPAEESAAGAIPGSINIGLEGSFATWVGTLIPRNAELIVVAPAGREREAALRCGRIGFNNVSGYLDGGIGAWTASGRTLIGFEPVAPSELPAFAAKGGTLLDVRTEAEREDGAIPGSLPVPLARLPKYLETAKLRSPITVYCAGGYRSGIAASVLRRAGYVEARDVQGGFAAYRASGLPIEEPAHA